MSEKAIQQKQQIVSELQEKIEKSQAVIFYDYIGLTVAEVTELRNNFRNANVEYKVIKNTMIARAAQGLNIEGLDATLEGPTAVAFGYDDPVAPAKILTDFIKKAKKTEIKAGILNGQVVDLEAIKMLSELPSKEELLAKLLGGLQSPISGLAMSLSGIIRKVFYALNAVKDTKEA